MKLLPKEPNDYAMTKEFVWEMGSFELEKVTFVFEKFKKVKSSLHLHMARKICLYTSLMKHYDKGILIQISSFWIRNGPLLQTFDQKRFLSAHEPISAL